MTREILDLSDVISMEKLPSFRSPIFASREVEFNNEAWDKIKVLQSEKKYREQFFLTLNYIHKDQKIPKDLGVDGQLELMHGYRPLTLRWDSKKIYIKSIIAKSPTAESLAFLRKVGEFSFYDLRLVKMDITADVLSMSFEDYWERLDPYKVFDVFEDICTHGDHYDGLLNYKFSAQDVYSQSRRNFSKLELDAAWAKFQQLIQETKSYMDYFESKRWKDINVELFWNFLMKIDFLFYPQGSLRQELKAAVNDLNANQPFESIYTKVFLNFNKIKEFPREQFDISFFQNNLFMPVKRTSYLERSKIHFEDFMKNAVQYKSKQDYILTSLYLTTSIYNYMNKYFIDPQLRRYLIALLKKSEGRTWKEGSEILYQGIERYLVQPQVILQNVPIWELLTESFSRLFSKKGAA